MLFVFSSGVKVITEDSSSFDILFCSSLLVWHDARLLLTERAQRLERLHELEAQRRHILKALCLSGRKHAASAVLANHHGNASGQMLCMSIPALTDLCLMLPTAGPFIVAIL